MRIFVCSDILAEYNKSASFSFIYLKYIFSSHCCLLKRRAIGGQGCKSTEYVIVFEIPKLLHTCKPLTLSSSFHTTPFS